MRCLYRQEGYAVEEQLSEGLQKAIKSGEHFAEQLDHSSGIKQAKDATNAFLNEIRKLPCDQQDFALASAEEKNHEHRATNPKGIGFEYGLVGDHITRVELSYTKAGANGKGESQASLPIYDLPTELQNCKFLPKQSDMR